MALDVRGSLKNTRISKNPYVVFEELLSNAIDSFLIRQNEQAATDSLDVKINIEFSSIDLLDEEFDIAITCTDNGCGIGDQQMDAFLTKDTSYKDDLAIAGIGQCKGAGRIQFFHHFKTLSIQSAYLIGALTKERTLYFDGSQNVITRNSFHEGGEVGCGTGTTVRLGNLTDKAKVLLKSHGDAREFFSANNVRGHLLIAFLQRLVGLAGALQDFKISIATTETRRKADEPIKHTAVLTPEDLPKPSDQLECVVEERDPWTGEKIGIRQRLRVSHYILDANKFPVRANAIALCAKSSPVKDITGHYLKSKTVSDNPISGQYHLILVEGNILDETVNEQRDDFDLPEEIPGSGLFNDSRISFESIREALYDVIAKLIELPDWDKAEVISVMAKEFGVSEIMVGETQTRVRHGDRARDVAERVLKKYQDRIIENTAQIIDLKEELKNVEPDSEQFREKVNEIAWRYTSTLQEIDKANLSQIVVRRAAIVEILAMACEKRLSVQVAKTGDRRKDEQIIHNIFFPMKKDSTETADHDIWLLSEEYSYYHYIASDKPLSGIKCDLGGNLFDDDIDQELAKLFAKNTEDNSKKRPDIALFTAEGSVIIVEFKAPGVEMADHTNDLMEYAQLLAAKSNGRLRKFYGYLVGDTVNPNRIRGYTRFPVGKGYFGTDPIVEHTTHATIGELYSEILFYDDLVTRASQRLAVYKEKLGLKIA